jgi:hypothetical protein
MDGPNYEAVFQKMQALHGGNPEDVKIIVRYLRFYQGQDGFEMYAKHYLPMLSPEVAAEFLEKKEDVSEKIVTETVSIPVPKKKGRPSKK